MKPSKDPLKALSDPLRISLFELIKEGAKTTPELAEILGENRLNLYHHLNTLEKSGLVSSTYNSDRVKVYRATSHTPNIQHKQQATTIQFTPKPKISSETIILSPPSNTEKYKIFKSKLHEIAKLCGHNIKNNQEILQVQITSEEKEVYQIKAKRSNNLRKNKK